MEKMKPVKICKTTISFECPNCGHHIVDCNDDICDNCGIEFDWSDEE